MNTQPWFVYFLLFATPLARPLAQTAEETSSFGTDMLILLGLIVLGIVIGVLLAYGPGLFRRRRR